MSHPHTVLVVDDDIDIRETLVEVLADHGYATLSAANGREALQRLRLAEAPPCLILLDLMMPTMDGGAFREEQLRDPRIAAIPVIVISASADLSARAQLLSAGHLRKPLRLPDMLAAVERHCCEGHARGPSAGDAEPPA